jgi:hypothetical protein
VSFSTVGGYVSEIDYDVMEGAGTNNDNVLVRIDYNAVVETMNYWEENLKYGDNPIAILIRIPRFLGMLWGFNQEGQIVIQPATVILRLTRIFELLNTVGKFTAPAELGSSM